MATLETYYGNLDSLRYVAADPAGDEFLIPASRLLIVSNVRKRSRWVNFQLFSDGEYDKYDTRILSSRLKPAETCAFGPFFNSVVVRVTYPRPGGLRVVLIPILEGSSPHSPTPRRNPRYRNPRFPAKALTGYQP